MRRTANIKCRAWVVTHDCSTETVPVELDCAYGRQVPTVFGRSVEDLHILPGSLLAPLNLAMLPSVLVRPLQKTHFPTMYSFNMLQLNYLFNSRLDTASVHAFRPERHPTRR